MKNKVGPAVSGVDFFDRPREIKKILRALESETNVLISSPRRVGKTSILYRLADTAEDNYHFIYVITQSVNTESAFYKRLSDAILKSDSLTSSATRVSSKTRDFLKKTIDRIKSVKGVELNPGVETDYRERFIGILKSLQLDGAKIVLMIDEFTQTIENIMRKEGEAKAIHFLQSMREIRQDEEMRKEVLFILTGSVGLENIVARLASVDLIADLNSVKVNPLSEKEAKEMIHAIFKATALSIGDEQISYVLEKIEWFIPFYIQLFVQELTNVCADKETSRVTKPMIDTSFKEMLKHRNHFEHWQTRLKKSFKKEAYKFAEEVLSVAARKKAITANEILNLAVRFDVEEKYKPIIHALMYDGYVNNNDDPAVYRFNSPI